MTDMKEEPRNKDFQFSRSRTLDGPIGLFVEIEPNKAMNSRGPSQVSEDSVVQSAWLPPSSLLATTHRMTGGPVMARARCLFNYCQDRAQGQGYMAQTVQLTLGSKVTCTDGKCGLVHSLVVDPAGPSVTHLVVEPEHRIGLGRLVPMGLVGSSGAVVELTSDLAEFNSLPLAESTELMPDLGAGYVFLRSAELQRPEVREVLPEGEAGLGSGTQVVDRKSVV